MILLPGVIPSDKDRQDVSKTGRAEAPQGKKLASSTPDLLLSGQAADSRKEFEAEGHCKGMEVFQIHTKAASGPRV